MTICKVCNEKDETIKTLQGTISENKKVYNDDKKSLREYNKKLFKVIRYLSISLLLVIVLAFTGLKGVEIIGDYVLRFLGR